MAIFEDDFEDNNLDAWSGQNVASGCTAETLSTAPACNTYHAHFETDADGNNAHVYETYSGQTEVWTKIHFRLNGAPGAEAEIIRHEGTDWVTRLIVRSTRALKLYYRDGASQNFSNIAGALDVGTYYTLKIKTVVDGAAGEHRVFRNGDEVATVTGVDTDDYGNITRSRVGILWFSSAWDVYVDYAVIDSSDPGDSCPAAAGVACNRLLVGAGL